MPAGSFRGAPKYLNASSQVLLYKGSDAPEDGGGGRETEAPPIWKISWREDFTDSDNEFHDDPPSAAKLDLLWSDAVVTENIPDHQIGWDFSQRGGTSSSPPAGDWTCDNGSGIWG